MFESKVVKTRPIVIGGAVRNLKYAALAARLFEQELNLEERKRSFGGYMQQVFNGERELSVTAFTALLWAGLVHENPPLEIKTVADWLNMEDMPALFEEISQAIAASQDKKKGKDTDAESQSMETSTG